MASRWRHRKVEMAYFRKRLGKWKVDINKRNYPRISKTFLDKTTARKWAKNVEVRIYRNIDEDFSIAETTTLKDLIIKYRDEIVPEQKAHRQTTSKLNSLMKYKIAYLNLMQLKSSHIYQFKKEFSVDRAPKTVNIHLQLLTQIRNTAKREWSITLPAQGPMALVTLNKVHGQRKIPTYLFR